MKKSKVYKEILTKFSIEPKITLKNYYNYSLSEIEHLTQIIWNASVRKHTNTQSNCDNINQYLIDIDIKTFRAKSLIKDILYSENVLKYAKGSSLFSNFACPEKELVNIFTEAGFCFKDLTSSCYKDLFSNIYRHYSSCYQLDYSSLLTYFENYQNDFSFTKNVAHLIYLNKKISSTSITLDEISLISDEIRERKATQLPVKLLIIVEGITEEKLLPVFAEKINFSFDKNGIFLLGAGGKNQVAKIYTELYEKIKIPILIILDKDAEKIAKNLTNILKTKDKLFLIPDGEFEDILPISLIHKSVNTHFKNTAILKKSDFISENESMASILYNIWKENGFGEFNKSEFANIIAENINTKDDFSNTLETIFEYIKEMASRV